MNNVNDYLENEKANSGNSDTKSFVMNRLKWICIVAFVIFLLGSCSISSKNKAHSATCKSCGRTFSYSASDYSFDPDVDDVNSIQKSGMCTNCHDNFVFSENLKKSIR